MKKKIAKNKSYTTTTYNEESHRFWYDTTFVYDNKSKKVRKPKNVK